MALHALILFCLAYFLAVATPGPGIAAIVARVLSRGSLGLAPFIAGYVVGDLSWFTLAATGMAMLARSAHTVFVLIRYAGAAYLLYLAYKLWTAPTTPPEEGVAPKQERGAQLFLASLSLTLSNPKAMIFYLALLPTVIDLSNLTLRAFFELALALSIILCLVLLGYAVAALRARRLFRSSGALRWLNRSTGTVLAGIAILVAARDT
jgi:threonine/homoserine/homoserine lactone efflux protein